MLLVGKRIPQLRTFLPTPICGARILRKARPRLHPWLHSIRRSAKLCEPPPRSIALSLTLTLEQPRLPPTWKKSCSKPILETEKRLPALVTFMLIASNSSRHHLTGNEFRWFLLACPAAI